MGVELESGRGGEEVGGGGNEEEEYRARGSQLTWRTRGNRVCLMTLIICAPSGANWTSPTPSSPPLSAANPCGSHWSKPYGLRNWVAHTHTGPSGLRSGAEKVQPTIPDFFKKNKENRLKPEKEPTS